jgi:hypothetical protein
MDLKPRGARTKAQRGASGTPCEHSELEHAAIDAEARHLNHQRAGRNDAANEAVFVATIVVVAHDRGAVGWCETPSRAVSEHEGHLSHVRAGAPSTATD